MNRKAFEQFFQKPEGFFWDNELQMYYEHKDYRFKYPLEAIGNFNQKWYGWLAAQQVAQRGSEYTYTGTGSDYLDCVLGVGGFEQYGPIDKEQKQSIDKLHPSWNDPDRGWI